MRRRKLTSQKPRFRASQHRMGQVTRWIDAMFPEFKEEDERERPLIMFAGEARIRFNYHVGWR